MRSHNSPQCNRKRSTFLSVGSPRWVGAIWGGIGLIGLLLGIAGCGDEEAVSRDAQNELKAGWQAYALSEFTSALRHFERAVAQAPTLADAHNGLGWARLNGSAELSVNVRLLEQSLEAFQDALRYDPRHADAWVGLANVLFLRRKTPRDFSQAIEAVENAQSESDPEWLYRHDYTDPSTLLLLQANCYYYLGDKESAADALNRALDIAPEQPTALTLQGMLKL